MGQNDHPKMLGVSFPKMTTTKTGWSNGTPTDLTQPHILFAMEQTKHETGNGPFLIVKLCQSQMLHVWTHVQLYLVGGLPTPLRKKNQLGLLFPIYGKIKFMFRTTNQNMVKS
jgi:hypothetical protein